MHKYLINSIKENENEIQFPEPTIQFLPLFDVFEVVIRFEALKVRNLEKSENRVFRKF
jgi:hypothetical protein